MIDKFLKVSGLKNKPSVPSIVFKLIFTMALNAAKCSEDQ